MTRPARGTLSAWIVVAMAVGALLLVPVRAGAVTGSAGPGSMVAAGSHRIHPGELRRLLDPIVAAGAPGAAARVRDGHRVTQAASGLADLRTGRRMRPGLHYRVGSVTKPFVATVVLQLVGEGKLSLSDTVERWLPGILPYGDQVTIRQLLNHTSGVPDNSLEPLVILYTSPHGRARAWRPRQLVALIADRPPEFALLDVSLIREKSFAVAERLEALKIPFAFVTGYGADAGLPEAFATKPRLPKPCSTDALQTMLRYRGAKS